MKHITFFILFFTFTNLYANSEKSIIHSNIHDYLDFASYADGVITPEQLNAEKKAFIIDTRKNKDFIKGNIPNSVNIEWRNTLNNINKIPKDELIVVYCDTGILSSKSHLILKLLGWNNVHVLFGGYQNWLKFEETLK